MNQSFKEEIKNEVQQIENFLLRSLCRCSPCALHHLTNPLPCSTFDTSCSIYNNQYTSMCGIETCFLIGGLSQAMHMYILNNIRCIKITNYKWAVVLPGKSQALPICTVKQLVTPLYILYNMELYVYYNCKSL